MAPSKKHHWDFQTDNESDSDYVVPKKKSRTMKTPITPISPATPGASGTSGAKMGLQHLFTPPETPQTPRNFAVDVLVETAGCSISPSIAAQVPIFALKRLAKDPLMTLENALQWSTFGEQPAKKAKFLDDDPSVQTVKKRKVRSGGATAKPAKKLLNTGKSGDSSDETLETIILATPSKPRAKPVTPTQIIATTERDVGLFEKTSNPPATPTVPAKKSVSLSQKTTKSSKATPTVGLPALMQKIWTFLLKPNIFEALKEGQLDAWIDETTPWEYLLVSGFQNVPLENQVLVLSKGLEKGFLNQSSMIGLAQNPLVEDGKPPGLDAFVKQQVRLAKMLEGLGGVVSFSRTSVLAAMRFTSTTPAPSSEPTSFEKDAIYEDFRELDMIAKGIVEKEWKGWTERDLAQYYRAFVQIVDEISPRYGVYQCFMSTVAFLGSRRNGPASWDIAAVPLDDVEFFMGFRKRVGVSKLDTGLKKR